MNVRVPFCAPMVPPETGASSIARPAASAAAVTARALSTSMVEQSISSGLRVLHRFDQAALVQPDLAHMLAGGQHGDDDIGALAPPRRRWRRSCRRPRPALAAPPG